MEMTIEQTDAGAVISSGSSWLTDKCWLQWEPFTTTDKMKAAVFQTIEEADALLEWLMSSATLFPRKNCGI